MQRNSGWTLLISSIVTLSFACVSGTAPVGTTDASSDSVTKDAPGADTPPAGCVSDADCPEGTTCVDGACTKAPPAACAQDSDCAEGEVCVNAACQTAPPEPECKEDGDCAEGEVCVDGVCEDVPPEPECKEDSDCAEGEVCVNDTCQTAPPEPECKEDTDCEEGQTCEKGVCTDPEPECKDDKDCAPTEACVDGVCEAIASPECASDDDCLPGMSCVDGECVVALNPDCLTDAECEAEEYCDPEAFICQPMGEYGAPCDDSSQCLSDHCVKPSILEIGTCACKNDKDCPEGQTCTFSVCSADTPAGNSPYKALCMVDGDCLSQICIDGSCGCAEKGDDCPKGSICKAGVCEKEEPDCQNDKDCAKSEYCADGNCAEKKAAGSKCGAASECKAGVCSKTVCGCQLKVAPCPKSQECVKGLCVDAPDLKDVGEKCDSDDECASKVCIDNVCGCQSADECAGGQYCKAGACLKQKAICGQCDPDFSDEQCAESAECYTAGDYSNCLIQKVLSPNQTCCKTAQCKTGGMCWNTANGKKCKLKLGEDCDGNDSKCYTGVCNPEDKCGCKDCPAGGCGDDYSCKSGKCVLTASLGKIAEGASCCRTAQCKDGLICDGPPWMWTCQK